jgi:hypothetical protein
LIFSVAGAASAGLGYLIGWGEDTELHRQIAGTLGSIIMAALALYIGGPTADDALKDKYGGKDGLPGKAALRGARGDPAHKRDAETLDRGQDEPADI